MEDTKSTSTVAEFSNGKHAREFYDREEKLHHISHAIHSAQNVDEILIDLKSPLLDLFNAEALTIYAVDSDNNIIYSKVKSGDIIDEIQLPISPRSIAGFVATEQRLVNLADVNNPNELKKYHSELEFDSSWDSKSKIRSKSMLALPLIHKNRLMGVLQLVNKVDGGEFQALDENYAFLIAETLALAFHNQEKFIEQKPTKFSYLIQSGFISEDELTLTLAKSRKSGEDIERLLENDLYLRRVDIRKSLSNFYQIPPHDFDETIHPPAPELLGLEIDSLKKEHWMPLQYDHSGLVILINNPEENNQIEKIKKIFPDQKVEFRIALKVDINDLLTMELGDSTGEQDEELLLSESDDNAIVIEDDLLDLPEPVKEIKRESSGPVAELFNQILLTSCDHEVTDIHIEPGVEGKDIQVRLRKDGSCRVFDSISESYRDDLIAHIKQLASLDPEQKRIPQSGKITWNKSSVKTELEVVTFPTLGGVEDVMITLSPKTKRVPIYRPLGDLNFSDPNLDRIKLRLSKPRGLILVVGPEVSGKTSTLHSFAGFLNNPGKKIVSVEDPVEIVQEGLRQTQLDPKEGLDMTCALSILLKGTPDVILAGELGEASEIALALEAAQSRLVLATLQANSALETFEMLHQIGVDRDVLSGSLGLIVAQRLVPTLCPDCKKEKPATREEYDVLGKLYGEEYFPDLGVDYTESLTLCRPTGCKHCIFSGYSGSTAIHEVMEITEEMQNLIAIQASPEDIRSQAISDGMITLVQDGVYKVFKGDCDTKRVAGLNL